MSNGMKLHFIISQYQVKEIEKLPTVLLLHRRIRSDWTVTVTVAKVHSITSTEQGIYRSEKVSVTRTDVGRWQIIMSYSFSPGTVLGDSQVIISPVK